MSALFTKLLRDLLHYRSQVLAIAAVMACGVATFITSLSMLDSLSSTMQTYYDQHRFAQLFAHAKRAPEHVAADLARLDGIAAVETRIVERVTLEMPRLAEPASGQIVSVPDDPSAGLNLLHLRAGRHPRADGALEVLVSERFADAHDLVPGATVRAVLNGRLASLRVVGIALSPEYVYLISPGSILPENERFGVFWMLREQMEAAFDMTGAFNDVVLTVMPGADERELLRRIDTITAPYGGLGAYDRADQASHQFVANELDELKRMSMMVPSIFLGVAAFLLNIVLTRLVATQREQIAALKALGYSNREIGTHYFGFVLLITALAVVVGTIGGAFMGRGMTALYVEFFSFPEFTYRLHPRVVIFSAAVTIAAAAGGVFLAVRAAMKLPPAEAMRPQAPPSFRPTVLERLGVHRLVPPSIRMTLRQLERRPIKTSLAIFGVALATAILVVGNYTEDALTYVMDLQFNRVQQYDTDLVLANRTDSTALASIRALPGVLTVEPYRTLAATVRHGHHSKRIGILGLTRGDGVRRLLDMDGAPVPLRDDGIVLSDALARSLDITVGELLTIESMEGERRHVDVPVVATLRDFSGLAAYMQLETLNAAMREEHSISGAFLRSDAAARPALYRELREIPTVVAVNVKDATRTNFEETIGQSLQLMQPFFVTFSAIIAFGVIYNSARISLSERGRDLATLRVLGFTHGEVLSIQLGELAIVTGFALPLGCVLGYGLAWLTSNSANAELIQIPFVIEASTFAVAIIVVLVATALSAVVIRQRLRHSDLVSVLKSCE